MFQRSKYDNVLTGIIVGVVVPIVAYGLLIFIYDILDDLDILHAQGLAPNFRERTIGLLALVTNLIPLQFFSKKYCQNAMRGIVFPTLIYVCLWMYFYGRELLNI